MNPVERFRGSLLGLATGDALGTTVEFERPGTFDPVTGMTGGGVFGLKAGEWTDDTSMALCLADSLVECRGFNPTDQLERYVRWYKTGYLSSNGRCFDIGTTVQAALARFQRTHDAYCGSTDKMSAGNGSLMRLCPVPLVWWQRPEQAIEFSGDSSRTTHGARTAVDACRYFGALLVGALSGVEKQVLLSAQYSPVENYWAKHPLTPEIEEVASGSFKTRQPPAIESTGYVVKTLEAALWAFHGTSTFEDGCLRAVNLGGDADTCGAVYGQLAGAFYGERGIPQRWRKLLAHRALIESLAEKLYQLSLELQVRN
ncbi:MAG TPA: ADP-ribosylglycohydrolase family protein [Candidatus Sulfotelmatobacter sp.]|nr:ADP-ribosylglycohydrolase family protein [Candidatus Sulfotelmatobacter sp.]